MLEVLSVPVPVMDTTPAAPPDFLEADVDPLALMASVMVRLTPVIVMLPAEALPVEDMPPPLFTVPVTVTSPLAFRVIAPPLLPPIPTSLVFNAAVVTAPPDASLVTVMLPGVLFEPVPIRAPVTALKLPVKMSPVVLLCMLITPALPPRALPVPPDALMLRVGAMMMPP